VFGVSLSFIEQMQHRYRTSSELGLKPHASGPKPQLGVAAQALVRQLVDDHPNATLEELGPHMAAPTGVCVCLATIGRRVPRLEVPRQKSHFMPRSATRLTSSRPRAAYQQLMATQEASRLQFVDESGALSP
jgi:transposase